MYIKNLITVSNASSFRNDESTILSGLNQQAAKLQWTFVQNGSDRDYTANYDFFKSISTSKLHLVNNSLNAIDINSSLSILHAMNQRKPIILLNPPLFTKDVELFSRELIMARLNKILLCNLTMLDTTDLQQFLSNSASQPVNYVITKHEEVLIRAKLRTKFRALLA